MLFFILNTSQTNQLAGNDQTTSQANTNHKPSRSNGFRPDPQTSKKHKLKILQFPDQTKIVI